MIESRGQVGGLKKEDQIGSREEDIPRPGPGNYILLLGPLGTVRFSGNSLPTSVCSMWRR